MRRRLLLLGVLACTARAALADHHLMMIREVYAGSDADPSTQYVMLQMYSPLEQAVTKGEIVVYDGTGANPVTFAFAMDVSNGANQATVLMGTSSLATAFGVTPDATMGAPALSRAAGKACYVDVAAPNTVWDCVAWGAYTGGATGVGNPVAPSGIPSGMAIRRKITRGDPSILDLADDSITNDSATDFEVVTPDPIPNSTPVSSSTTSTTVPGGGGSSTTTSIPSHGTTTTTLPCPAAGVDGALCLLDALPPQPCRRTPLPRKVRATLQAATNILRRAQTTIGHRHDRLVRRAFIRLGTSLKAIENALAKTGKLTPECANPLQAFVQAARERLAAVLPAS